MRRKRTWFCLLALLFLAGAQGANAQGTAASDDSEFGPVVRAYLGYLKNEQEVVDDRASRREISRAYYVRNSNRIRALRQMALRIARETANDYLPELEAAAGDELKSLFERPPRPASLRVGEVYNNTFRFLGSVRSGDTFYIFARLDIYEQAELMEKERAKPSEGSSPTTTTAPATGAGEARSARPRRVGTP